MITGRVLKAKVGEFPDEKSGEIITFGNLDVKTADDTFAMKLDDRDDAELLDKLSKVRKGSTVKVLMGIKSGKDAQADAKFTVVDIVSNGMPEGSPK
jgi:hypothetical protein